jgi:hypothetical protein
VLPFSCSSSSNVRAVCARVPRLHKNGTDFIETTHDYNAAAACALYTTMSKQCDLRAPPAAGERVRCARRGGIHTNVTGERSRVRAQSGEQSQMSARCLCFTRSYLLSVLIHSGRKSYIFDQCTCSVLYESIIVCVRRSRWHRFRTMNHPPPGALTTIVLAHQLPLIIAYRQWRSCAIDDTYYTVRL